MKLLICVTALNDIESFLKEQEVTPIQHQEFPFLYTVNILHHEVHILKTGAGIYQTTYKLTKVLARQKYHLALKLSFGNAYKAEYAVGTVLNIVNEKPGDYGMLVNGDWKDHYDFNLLNREEAPHVRGGFVNLTNAYMNIFMPYKKVVGVTVNHYADKLTYEARITKYKADVETGDGLGFVYPCLYERQNFYHLCVIERNMETGDEEFMKAKETMAQSLQKLASQL